MNLRVILAAAGLVVGGALGWATAPEVSTMRLGPLNLEVTEGGGEVTAESEDGEVNVQVGDRGLPENRNARTAIFALIGAVVGFGTGFAVERRKA